MKFCFSLFVLILTILNVTFTLYTTQSLWESIGVHSVSLLLTRQMKLSHQEHVLMQIYFINLDESTDRRNEFESVIRSLPSHLSSTITLKRIRALTATDVESMQMNGTFVLNGIDEVFDSDVTHEWWDKKYTSREVACTLSHLKAIQQAYHDGHESALIVEDDAILTAHFLENWIFFSNLAPSDWTILQWATNNAFVNKKESHRSNDFWVSWCGYHWSTIAYTINRKGMKRVLLATSNLFALKTRQNSLRWRFDQENMLAADELIYFIAGNSYTSTFCWVTPHNTGSTISSNHRAWSGFRQSQQFPSIKQLQELQRPERIAVIMNVRLRSTVEIDSELCSLAADIQMLSTFNPHTKWFVKAVLTSTDLLPLFYKIMAEIPSERLSLIVEVTEKSFNKFQFVCERIEEFGLFDYVLLKDNDIRLAGFEWNTFLNKSISSIVSAPFRIDIEHTTKRWKKPLKESKRKKSFIVGLQDAALFNTYQDSYFNDIQSSPVMGLEMFMVLMKSDFAIWFLKQFLTSHFISQNIDWGPDLMWCSAALDYQIYNVIEDGLVSCSLVSVNVRHADTKQITKSADSAARGSAMLKMFMNDNPTFKRWMDGSYKHRMVYSDLLRWCKRYSEERWLADCMNDFRRQQSKKYRHLPIKMLFSDSKFGFHFFSFWT